MRTGYFRSIGKRVSKNDTPLLGERDAQFPAGLLSTTDTCNPDRLHRRCRSLLVLDRRRQRPNWRFHRPERRSATDLLLSTDHVCG